MKAMILCAGYGTRLGGLTEATPKPMLPLAGRPVLEYIITNLVRHGFNELAINLHYRPDIIKDYFLDGSKWGVKIKYSFESSLLGTAGGVKKLEDYFQGEELFLVHYGDILCDQNYSKMVSFHRSKSAIATILVHERARSNSIVSLDSNGKVIRFVERPGVKELDILSGGYVNSGVYLLSPAVFNYIPDSMPVDFPKDVFPGLAEKGLLFGFPLDSYRCAIDSPERYEEAELAIRSGKCTIPIDRFIIDYSSPTKPEKID